MERVDEVGAAGAPRGLWGVFDDVANDGGGGGVHAIGRRERGQCGVWVKLEEIWVEVCTFDWGGGVVHEWVGELGSGGDIRRLMFSFWSWSLYPSSSLEGGVSSKSAVRRDGRTQRVAGPQPRQNPRKRRGRAGSSVNTGKTGDGRELP